MGSFKGYKRTIQLDFDYDKVKKCIPKVNQQMSLLNAEYRKTAAQISTTGNVFDKLNLKQELYANKLKLQGDKINILQCELDKLTGAEEKNEKAIANKTIELKRAQAQYFEIENNIKKTGEEIKRTSEEFERQEQIIKSSTMDKKIELINAEFNKASVQAEITGNSFDRLAINNQNLGNQVKLQKDKVSQLEKELSKLTNSEVKNEKAIASKQIALKNAQTQLIKLEASYKSSNIELEKSKTLLGKARLELENFKTGAERAGIDLDKLKGDFLKTTAAITAFIGVTGKAYMSFEESMIKSRTIMDESKVSYEQMTKDVQNMANKYGMAAGEMAEANYQILSSSIDTAEANKVLEKSAILAKTGFTDVATAADILTSIMNGYGKSADEASVIVDQLIKTQKVGKLTIGELSSSMGDLIGISASVNVDIVEVEASIAAMTQSGIKADTAITNMKQILSAIANPTSQAAEAAKKYGIHMDAATISSKGFAKWLEEVLRKTNGNSAALGEMFGNVKSWSGMVNLAKNDAKAFSSALNEITNSTGSADAALQMIEATTGDKVKKSFNELKTSLIEIGDVLSPIIELFANIVGFIAKIPAPITLAVVAFASMAKIMTMLNTALIALGAGSGIASAGLAALGVSGGISMPVLLGVAAAVALVVGMLALLSGRAEKAKADINDMTKSVGSAAEKATNVTKKAKGAYATGTNFVKEDGFYRVNEYGQEEMYLNRGSRVDSVEKVRREEQKADMTETNNLLRVMIAELRGVNSTVENIPRTATYLERGARLGGAL